MANRQLAVGGVLVVLLFAAAIGAGFYYGVGPAPGGEGTGEEIDDFPTATPSDGGTEGSSASASTTETPPFSFTVENVEECGRTCRDVTTTLHNNRNETATGISVYIRIFAGENNTAEEDIVWEGKRDVGTIDAGGSRTSTERVDLSLNEARQVEQEGGWITILATVESDDKTVTFQNSEEVA